MRIWLINHYAVPVEYHPLARTTNFAKYLKQLGHEVLIFAASSVHNNPSVNLAEKKELYHKEVVDGIEYVLVRCRSYDGNGKDRILNMFEFPWKLKKVCKYFGEVDVILASSATPPACMMGLKIARKYGAKAIAEITDLWPESFVAYGLLDKRSFLLPIMYAYEKKLYKYADKIIFSLEGAFDYIIDRNWDKDIPQSKVYYINNGVDLELFNYNRDNFRIDDIDLNNKEIKKIIYVGSIRKVNNLGRLLEIAKRIENPKVKFLIWGDGDELSILKKKVADEGIKNVEFKGKVDKRYIPYIVSCAYINIVHNTSSSIFRYGISFNKIFDDLAAGKPILTDYYCRYDPVIRGNAGIATKTDSIEDIVLAINKLINLKDEDYQNYCKNALDSAKKYDFKNLTKCLIDILEE